MQFTWIMECKDQEDLDRRITEIKDNTTDVVEWSFKSDPMPDGRFICEVMIWTSDQDSYSASSDTRILDDWVREMQQRHGEN